MLLLHATGCLRTERVDLKAPTAQRAAVFDVRGRAILCLLSPPRYSASCVRALSVRSTSSWHET